jgi:hypothetical protein
MIRRYETLAHVLNKDNEMKEDIGVGYSFKVFENRDFCECREYVHFFFTIAIAVCVCVRYSCRPPSHTSNRRV